MIGQLSDACCEHLPAWRDAGSILDKTFAVGGHERNQSAIDKGSHRQRGQPHVRSVSSVVQLGKGEDMAVASCRVVSLPQRRLPERINAGGWRNLERHLDVVAGALNLGQERNDN